jgi:hypothetical protein
MTVETATTFAQLNPAAPTPADQINEGDDHIRLVKNVLRTLLASIEGPLTVSHTELNRIAGISANLMGLLADKADLNSPALTGTPTGPSPILADDSTRLATTAFVRALLSQSVALNLPPVAGKQWLSLTNNGTVADWGASAAESLAILTALEPS